MSKLFWLLVAGVLLVQCFSSCSYSPPARPSYETAIAESSYARSSADAGRALRHARSAPAPQLLIEGEVFGSGGKVSNLNAPICSSSSNTVPIKLVYDEQIRWATPSCSSSTYAYLLYNSSTGRFQTQNSSGTSPGLDTGGCSIASTSSGTMTCAGVVRYGKFLQSDGETQAALQQNATGTGGGLEYDTTNSRWRAYEGANWNFAVTENADAGTPLIAPIAAPATQVDGLGNTTVGFAAASDRGLRGTLLEWGNGRRFVQIGGAVNWALEQRTLALNPGHESTILTCDACSRSAASTFDGLTITDAAAAGTTVIDVVDFRTFVTAASAASVSSVVSRVAETRRNQFPHMVWTAMVTANTSERVWYGLSSVALNGADAPVGQLVAFRFSTNASDTKWQFCTGDGASTTCTDTGATVTANRLYTLELDCRDVAAGKCVATVQAQGTGTPVTIQKTTNLPTATSNMFIRHYCEALAASARSCGVGPSALETL